MARVLLLLGLVVVFYIQGSVARIAPDYIKPCPGPTPECLKNTTQHVIPLFVKGVPSLGIDSLDPLSQGYVSVDLPGGFKVEFFDSTVHGFRKCIVDTHTFMNEESILDFHCNLTIKGKYKAKGQILVVNIDGDGDAKIRIADYIKPCPGLTSECLKNTIQEVIPLFVKGNPSLGIEPIDPLSQSYVSVDLPGGFKVELIDGTVHGFRKCIVDSVSYKNNEAKLDFHCNVTIKGKYKAKGQILVVSINGDGDAKIRAGNVAVKTKIKFHDVTRDGVVYHEIEKYDMSYTIKDKVTYALTNLFKGNPELSQAVLQFLNENWKQLAEEFGKPVFDKVVEIAFAHIDKFFKSVPKSELFID